MDEEKEVLLVTQDGVTYYIGDDKMVYFVAKDGTYAGKENVCHFSGPDYVDTMHYHYYYDKHLAEAYKELHRKRFSLAQLYEVFPECLHETIKKSLANESVEH